MTTPTNGSGGGKVTPINVARLQADAKKAAKRKRRPKPPSDGRPVIRISVELHENVDESVAALGSDLGLYQRAIELVHVVRPDEPDNLMSPGTPQIRPVLTAQLSERLTRVAHYQRWDARKGDYRPCLPSTEIVQAVAARGEWPGIRPLVGVVESPTLRPDGTVVQKAGYDRATGYEFQPQTAFPKVKTKPSQSVANEALLRLCEVFADFPFTDDAARYVPIAALLTLLARPAIRGSVPAFVIDKSTRGSGGTLINDAVAVIASGREAARMTWPADDAELEKILGAYALRGASIINFDNVATTFGGGPLDRVLTATDRVELRVLGKSEIPALRWRAVVLASGNNVVFGPDTTRRVLVARLEPTCERPEERTDFKHPDLVAWLRKERAKLVHDALTILRAHVVAGRPKPEGMPAWGSFEPWRELVAAALVFAGGPDVLSCRATGAGAVDPELAALRAILAHWPRLAPEGITAKNAVQALYPRERLMGEAAPDGFDDLRDAIEVLVPTAPTRPPSVRKLGARLRGLRGRVVNGLRIEAASNQSGTTKWMVAGAEGGHGGHDPNPSRLKCQKESDTSRSRGADQVHHVHLPEQGGTE
jgi:hypothetical protein